MTSPIANNLRLLRRRAGLTQEALALACGLSGQSAIANYESTAPKANQPSPEMLLTLASALGVGVAELFGEPAAAAHSHGTASHLERIDFEIMATATKALQDFAELTGRPLEWVADPELLEVAYGVVESHGADLGDSLSLAKQLARRIRGMDGDGESAGAAAGTAGRRTGDKAGGGDKGN